MHRADYQNVLATEARRLGAEIRLNCDVVSADCDYPPSVVLASGERLHADIVVGADGLRSSVRTAVLGYVKEPEESGDLAYRITIPRELLEGEKDPLIGSVINENASVIWWGPGFHVVLYAVRHAKIINMVLM
jgi:salicylate hydroxylase